MKRQRAAGVFLGMLVVGAIVACGGKQVDGSAAQNGPPSSDGDPSGGASSAPSDTPARTTPFVPHAPAKHRARATACMQGDAGPGDGSPDASTKDGGAVACTSDSDCPGTVCECGQDFVCFDKNRNVCNESGNCRIDADCGPGGYCSFSSDGAYCGYQHAPGYYCHTARDTCSDDSDCPRDEYGPESCQINSDNTTWSCRPAGP